MVEEAALLEKAEKVTFASRLRGSEAEREALLDYTTKKYELVEQFNQNMSQIEFNKFNAMIAAIGADTLQSIALSGPELQVSLLSGLGLNSTLIMDGSNPLNLFNTAQSLIAKNTNNTGNVSSNNNNNNTMRSIANNNNNITNSKMLPQVPVVTNETNPARVDEPDDDDMKQELLNDDVDQLTRDIQWNESDDGDDYLE